MIKIYYLESMIGAKQKMKHITVTLIILFTLQLFAGMSHAEDTSFWDQFKDPQDGQFDIIGDKEMATGFLPVVIPFNEPTIGLGAVGALAYFHPKAPTDSSGSSVPPSISFAGGLYSDNKTWSVAGGHMGVWDQGNTRYVGALVYASVNLDFYGIGAESPDSEEPIPYNIEGGGTIQQMEFRLGDSNFFAGTKYEFSSTYGTFNTDEEMDEDGRNRNAGLGIYTSYVPGTAHHSTLFPGSNCAVSELSGTWDTMFSSVKLNPVGKLITAGVFWHLVALVVRQFSSTRCRMRNMPTTMVPASGTSSPDGWDLLSAWMWPGVPKKQQLI